MTAGTLYVDIGNLSPALGKRLRESLFLHVCFFSNGYVHLQYMHHTCTCLMEPKTNNLGCFGHAYVLDMRMIIKPHAQRTMECLQMWWGKHIYILHIELGFDLVVCIESLCTCVDYVGCNGIRVYWIHYANRHALCYVILCNYVQVASYLTLPSVHGFYNNTHTKHTHTQHTHTQHTHTTHTHTNT